MQVSAVLLRKGALRMRALVEDINRYAEKCANYAGSVAPGSLVEFEDFDSIINELDRALLAIRTLDLEVLQASDKTAYETLRDNRQAGRSSSLSHRFVMLQPTGPMSWTRHRQGWGSDWRRAVHHLPPGEAACGPTGGHVRQKRQDL